MDADVIGASTVCAKSVAPRAFAMLGKLVDGARADTPGPRAREGGKTASASGDWPVGLADR